MSITQIGQLFVTSMIFCISVYGVVRYVRQSKKTEKKLG